MVTAVISRMIGTSVFSDGTEFSVTTVAIDAVVGVCMRSQRCQET